MNQVEYFFKSNCGNIWLPQIGFIYLQSKKVKKNKGYE